jgi:hypothetical protein
MKRMKRSPVLPRVAGRVARTSLPRSPNDWPQCPGLNHIENPRSPRRGARPSSRESRRTIVFRTATRILARRKNVF